MIIKYKDLCSTDFVFGDVAAYRRKLDDVDIYNYEEMGRTKHLIYYQIKNGRNYYFKDEYICTVNPGDVICLPHGTKYRSFNVDQTIESDGIGISFNLYTPDGEQIFIDEDIKVMANDSFDKYYKSFKKILYSVMNPAENVLKLKGQLYNILDELFNVNTDFNEAYGDIKKAISILENNPELNISTKELADMCLMSESSFLRKFKVYSGGIAPIKYRTNIRLMLAEEMANSLQNMNEIAEQLGFYDASHLCKIYKQEKGYTLKKKDY